MSSRMGRMAWLGVVAGLAICGTAMNAGATDQRAKTIPAFEQLDRNNDDRLSRTEAGYNRQLEAMFVDSDVDGDGFVTRSEYAAATQQIVISEARR